MSSDTGDVIERVPSAPGPTFPLTDSYTYHSPTPTKPGPYILGVDEAGRGPVIGPLVYGVAFCPASWKSDLDNLGFADSKTLTHESRSGLLRTLSSQPEYLAWAVRVIAPQAISAGMMRRPPINLNRQSEEATVGLIRHVLQQGIELTEVYVDALGSTTTYAAYLRGLFPTISFVVETKADAKYKIVGAASIAAKVTRDACIEEFVFEEKFSNEAPSFDVGSGYPSDPKTQFWIKESIEPTFGYPKIVRFSWSTIKVAIEKNGYPVTWIDEGHASLVKAFETSTGKDKDRCIVTKDLAISSVTTL